VVAVLDSDPDTTELLKTLLEVAGMVVATGSLIDFRLGKDSILAFLDRTKPDVILYDLGLPYESNFHFLQKMREDPAFPACGLVITTTNARVVENLLGVHAIEIHGKPYDLDALVRAVLTATPTAALPDEGSREGDRRNGDRRHRDRRTLDAQNQPDAPVH
jgi:DNA-binding response OmpR family regulator